MMTLSIVKYPAKVLSRPARRITSKDGLDLHKFEQDMFEAMRLHDGIGLAAPQVGEGIRFVVAHNSLEGRTRSFVNPQIIWMSDEEELGVEGCLSFPGVIGDVWRSTSIQVKFQDIEFNTYEEEFEGYYARVLQHEIDHVNGVLLCDRAEHGLRVPGDDESDEDNDDYEDEVEEEDEFEEQQVDRELALPRDPNQVERY